MPPLNNQSREGNRVLVLNKQTQAGRKVATDLSLDFIYAKS